MEGNGALNESCSDRREYPRWTRGRGDSVSAATLNRSGFLKSAGATRVGNGTALIPDHSDGQRCLAATRAPIAKSGR
ncbi:MAG: hypothetical protein ACLUD0_10470 [Eubacterium ramulus]